MFNDSLDGLCFQSRSACPDYDSDYIRACSQPRESSCSSGLLGCQEALFFSENDFEYDFEDPMICFVGKDISRKK